MTSQTELPSIQTDRHSIIDLSPGLTYRITVETVVKSKLYLDEEKFAVEKFQTVQISSDPLLSRTLPDFSPISLGLNGYNNDSFSLKWLAPVLWTESVMATAGQKPRVNKRFQFCLIGFKLFVQGDLHRKFSPAATSCRISKCKNGRTYRAYLVAVVVDLNSPLSTNTVRQPAIHKSLSTITSYCGKADIYST